MKRTLMVVLVVGFLQACAGTPEYGKYTHDVLSSPSVEALMEMASCNGAGLQTIDVSAGASGSSRGGGHTVSGRRTASCHTYGGVPILPPGVRLNPQQGAQHAR